VTGWGIFGLGTPHLQFYAKELILYILLSEPWVQEGRLEVPSAIFGILSSPVSPWNVGYGLGEKGKKRPTA